MKFRDTAAAAPYYVTLTADEAKRHLTTWRQGNHKITKLWDTLETAAVLSIQNPGTVIPLDHGMAFLTSKGTTRVKKPNGVPLFYHNMRIWQGDLIFDGVNGTTKKWGIEKAYGGRLTENLTQSVARDVMAEIMRSGTRCTPARRPGMRPSPPSATIC